MSRVLRIGGASGAWGDSIEGPIQRARSGKLDVLSFDYLAETTMSLLARARAKDPGAGWATDFVDGAMRAILPEVARQGLRVVSNAGGLNPAGCADALHRLCKEMGLPLRIAIVEGDDILDRVEAIATPAPAASFLSANAYLGAFPIAQALNSGAQVVITGRCVDSALPLGACIHAFGWGPEDWDRLAAGSLAGHLLECGPQGCGGLHTDWEKVERWEDIGYPIAECREDGSFVMTKPGATGGLVTPAVIAEQMLYEIGDPSAYVLPDVVCDFTQVVLEQDGPDRVQVRNVRGRPRTSTYKVSATYQEGWRGVASLAIIGIDAARKAERTAAAVLARARKRLHDAGLADFERAHVEVLGSESVYGPHSRARTSREVVMRLVVDHADREAIELFAREIGAAGISWAPGTTGMAGRPKPVPIVRLQSLLVPKAAVPITIRHGDERFAANVATSGTDEPPPPLTRSPGTRFQPGAATTVPLIQLAYARSGDKGDTANIGVIARNPDFLPYIDAALGEERVAAYFAHLVKGRVMRFAVPGIHGFNFLLTGALEGGGLASPRIDPLAKAMAQMLLDIEVPVPADLARALASRGTAF
jgi:hypothetical protein